jgi:predicted HicB family RNase H-like nuclease
MHGSVINTRAVLHFAGGNIEELRQAFADKIADYREWCKERGVEAEKPYSETLSLRIAPECIAALPKRPRRQERASISSSPGALKRAGQPTSLDGDLARASIG